jgi:hypothetical protein
VATFTGRCLCGGVQFEVTEPFERVTYCHCSNCKKISGGAGTVNARSRTEAIKIVEGESLLRTYQPPEGTLKTFCSVCGSNLFGGGWPESEHSSVRVSALDAFEDKPSAHIFVRSVAPWETLPDDGARRY